MGGKKQCEAAKEEERCPGGRDERVRGVLVACGNEKEIRKV